MTFQPRPEIQYENPFLSADLKFKSVYWININKEKLSYYYLNNYPLAPEFIIATVEEK